MKNDIAAPLSGSLLEAFLNECDAAVERETEAHVAFGLIQAHLRAALQEQPCRPDNLTMLRRLYRLWLQTGDHTAALRVIDENGPDLIEDLNGLQKQHSRVSLAFARVDVLQSSTDATGRRQALLITEKLLTELPGDEQADESWAYLAEAAEGAGEHDFVRRCCKARHALQINRHDRTSYRAWDDALLAVRLGFSYAAQGKAAEAQAMAQEALRLMASAGPDQDLDYDDSLRLAESLVMLAPDAINDILGQCRRRIAADATPARQRMAQVQLARLEARSFALRGRYAEAVTKGRQGRYCLRCEEDDSFSANMLDWLIAAGYNEEAAHIAFECVDNERQVSAERACHLAMQKVLEDPENIHRWALVLASAALSRDTQWVCGEEEATHYFNRHLALAKSWPALHSVIDALRARHLITSQQDYAGALPLLENAVYTPELASSKNLEQLWLCRIQVYGIQEAMTLPFIPAASAGWCYNLGVTLNCDLQAQLPHDIDWPKTLVEHLAARYYEAGLVQFESFFASGQGQYRDGDIHVYAMLCNNLAIYYRCTAEKYDLAIATHHKGIAASPFAEHYDGLMRCQRDSGNQASFVEAAERLWQFAAQHGYSRHAPCDYIDDVAYALHALHRHDEIATWMQRLEAWWNELNQEAREREEEGFLGALACVLANLAHTQPDAAMERLETALPRFRSYQRVDHVRIAGIVCEHAGQLARAISLYQEALKIMQSGKTGSEKQREYALLAIKRCKKLQRAGRPWWKFWR